MRSRSDWELVKQENGIVFLRDLNLGRTSVTNDAENVFQICQEHFGPCRVVYQDSDGVWEEIVMYKGITSAQFAPWQG